MFAPLLYTHRMRRALCLLLAATAFAQWISQNSHTTASLRGIHAVSPQVAWASGSGGAILRTTDGGTNWQRCATPPDGDKLDFRGIWAWDAGHAVAMSSGPGDLSRLFETTDACAHWTEKLKNSDKDGFWDALVFQSADFGFAKGGARTGMLVGDPIMGKFDGYAMLSRQDFFVHGGTCDANPGEALFAASNSSIFVFGARGYIIVTGGKGGARAILSPLPEKVRKPCLAAPLPLASGADSAGAFSVYFRDRQHGVVVGGDFQKPDVTAGTAAFTSDGGRHWTASTKLPHGFRSAVTWDPAAKLWIAVGTNGSDTSADDGKTWQPLDNGKWNAISLPFAVGPGGRIARRTP